MGQVDLDTAEVSEKFRKALIQRLARNFKTSIFKLNILNVSEISNKHLNLDVMSGHSKSAALGISQTCIGTRLRYLQCLPTCYKYEHAPLANSFAIQFKILFKVFFCMQMSCCKQILKLFAISIKVAACIENLLLMQYLNGIHRCLITF